MLLLSSPSPCYHIRLCASPPIPAPTPTPRQVIENGTFFFVSLYTAFKCIDAWIYAFSICCCKRVEGKLKENDENFFNLNFPFFIFFNSAICENFSFHLHFSCLAVSVLQWTSVERRWRRRQHRWKWIFMASFSWHKHTHTQKKHCQPPRSSLGKLLFAFWQM